MEDQWVKFVDLIFSLITIAVVLALGVACLVAWDISSWLYQYTSLSLNKYLAVGSVFGVFILGSYWVSLKTREWLDWN